MVSGLQKLQTIKNDWHYWLQAKIGLHPSIYFSLYAKKFPFKQMAVNNQTQICIEGYPRSANSYAVVAFKLQNQEVKVGHHLHVPAQIIKACRLKIPTLVVIRQPEQAVVSFLVFQLSTNADLYLKAYEDFYKPVLKLKHLVLITDFSSITADFNKVINAVNKKFRTNYNLIDNLPGKQEEIFQKLREVNDRFFSGQKHKSMYPSPARDQYKQKVKEFVRKSPYLERANQIYEELYRESVKEK